MDRDTLISDNLLLVHGLCKRFANKGIEYDDLYQSGCIGLIKAADRFDESLGFAFSTYAYPVILGEIKRLFRDGGSVKVSRSIKELSLKINALSAKMYEQNGVSPTVNELAQALSVQPQEIAVAICSCAPPASLTANEENREGGNIDVADTDDMTERIDSTLTVDSMLKTLTPFERQIIHLRFFGNKTQTEVSKEMGITQVMVSRTEKKVLGKLRETCKI
ncbi:MAG: sigma-70 family RNA polymerase sigma factor [Oscillospiraceae bacterium]|nr:sigma-70 family RNA polymerase sigma factor [Candidatus Equicaccousia limihippi]